MGMENPKIQSPSRYNKRTGRYGSANNPDCCTACKADDGNLGNLEAVDHNGTVFAPKQCLYAKVAMGMENPKILLPSRCNKRTWRYCSANNPDSCTACKADNGNLAKLRSCRSQWYRVCTKAMFISKGSYGYGEPKNAIAFSMQ